MSSHRRYSFYAEIALPVPVPHTFSYGVPDNLLRAAPGVRARARLGRKVLVGCITKIFNELPAIPESVKLQPVLSLLDDEPALTEGQMSLAAWISDYYIASPGLVYRRMFPPDTPRNDLTLYERVTGANPTGAGKLVFDLLERPMTPRAIAKALEKRTVSRILTKMLRQGQIQELQAEKKMPRRITRSVRITTLGEKALNEDRLHPTTTRILTTLAIATEPVPIRSIRNELGIVRGPFPLLAKKKYIEITESELQESPWQRIASAGPIRWHSLTLAQSNVIESIRSALSNMEFKTFTLYGVTGSGKTEVYLRAAKIALEQKKTVLILVPEIALTPKLASVLHNRFGNRVAILHSALGSGEKRAEWWRIRHGSAQVVVGARAAVLAPLENIGLVVVDEEHEGSYKQEETPRYNARDVAIVRAQQANAVVILGSATPSVESYTRALNKHYELQRLPERIGNRPLADVDFIDMKSVVKNEGPEVIVSEAFRVAIQKSLDAEQQSLLLLNRRGFARQLICRQCGLPLMCSECNVAMTLHKGGSLAVCHYCGLGTKSPSSCNSCDGVYLKRIGYGTERLEQEVRKLFPDSRIERMDRDTMRKKGSYELLLSNFSAHRIDILVGTQMLAKGHDFPGVTFVGVLAADQGLSVPDFRAAERTFQLLTQVAGRAGRGGRPGTVLLQTFNPDHYSLVFAQAQDFEGFYDTEKSFRKALLYPPFVSVINIITEGRTMNESAQDAHRVAKYLKSNPISGVRILGPAFAVRSKISGRYRSQVLIKLNKNRHPTVRSRIRAYLETQPTKGTLTIDVDPVNLT